MTQWSSNHLTGDELDAFHSASLSKLAQAHLDECTECRALVESDRALLSALESLPRFSASAGFEDRVMARVTVRKAAVARRFAPRTLALAASLIVTLGASVAWSGFNRPLLLSWLDRAGQAVSDTFWTGLRVVASNLAGQSWFAGFADFAGSPSGFGITAGGMLLVFAAALYALRRLMLSPSRLPHANG
jgi:hypothetical protein